MDPSPGTVSSLHVAPRCAGQIQTSHTRNKTKQKKKRLQSHILIFFFPRQDVSASFPGKISASLNAFNAGSSSGCLAAHATCPNGQEENMLKHMPSWEVPAQPFFRAPQTPSLSSCWQTMSQQQALFLLHQQFSTANVPLPL